MNATNSTPLDFHWKVNATQKFENLLPSWLELSGVSEEKTKNLPTVNTLCHIGAWTRYDGKILAMPLRETANCRLKQR
jgi:hypothetical protein